MRKAAFSLGLIIASNVLIIGISMVYGLHIFPGFDHAKPASFDTTDEFKDLTIKKQTPLP